MIKKYIKCAGSCEQDIPPNEIVFAFNDLENSYDTIEQFQEYKNDKDIVIPMMGMCKKCAVQCTICRDWFKDDTESTSTCDTCKGEACSFDSKFCYMCEESYCHPANELIYKEMLLENPNYISCYDRHRRKELICEDCGKRKTIIFSHVDGVESFSFCMDCYDDKKDTEDEHRIEREWAIVWAKDRSSCPYSKEEKERRNKEEYEYVHSTSLENAYKILYKRKEKIEKEWDGYYLETPVEYK